MEQRCRGLVPALDRALANLARPDEEYKRQSRRGDRAAEHGAAQNMFSLPLPPSFPTGLLGEAAEAP